MWIWLIYVAVLGACIGSFLNVVIYRLPEGRSLVTPPSSCPRCGHRLAWYDNVPVLGWLWLRGRCRYCANPISVQYPVIEAATAVLFGGWFYVAYISGLRGDFAGPPAEATAAAFVVSLALIAGLVAATLIDARLYIIPLEIPWFITAVAVVALTASAAVFPAGVVSVKLPASPMSIDTLVAGRLSGVPAVYRNTAAVRVGLERGSPSVEVSPLPIVGDRGAAMGLAGVAGLLVALALLRAGVIRRSFEDEELVHDETPHVPGEVSPAADPQAWLAYPHARREVLKECLFVALPVLGAVIAAAGVDGGNDWPIWLRTLGGVLLGYIGGGAVVWGTRIIGTLGFGKEAMGLGDVHLMAAVGAVCGWQVAVLAFFVAPFLGLIWSLGSVGVAKMMGRQSVAIPYGPHLAVATLVVMALREPLVAYFGAWMA